MGAVLMAGLVLGQLGAVWVVTRRGQRMLKADKEILFESKVEGLWVELMSE